MASTKPTQSTINHSNGPVYRSVYPRGKFAGVQYDFIDWAREDRMPESKLVDHFTWLASHRCFANGHRENATIWTTAGPTLWSMTVLLADVPEVMRALDGMVKGDVEALLEVVRDWVR